MKHEIRFDFSEVLDSFHKHVRRASIFLGFGVNSARDPKATNYSLSGMSALDVAPMNATSDQIVHFKEEFESWVIGNALRELIEAFGKLTEEVYGNCLAIREIKEGRGLDAETRRSYTNFEKQGFPNRLNMIQQAFKVSPQHSSYLISLNRARSCLTHRRGIVADEDANLPGKLDVYWIGMDVQVEEPSGKTTLIQKLIEKGTVLRDGGKVQMKFVERRRVFRCGEVILFEPQDLAEICFFTSNEAKQIIKSMTDYAIRKGVTIISESGDDPSAA